MPLAEEPLAGGGSLAFAPAFYAPADADALFAAVVREADLRERTIVIFGREILQPRLVAFEGAPGVRYTYSGRTLDAAPFGPAIGRIRDDVEAATGRPFNAVLVNLYRDGRDSMGLHSDGEPGLGPVVASVSFGAVRRFVLRPRSPRADAPRGRSSAVTLDLPHGSLLVMGAGTQQAWRHEVPKQVSVKAPRLNLTFREVQLQPDESARRSA